jgi:hypothetical protein
VTDEKKDKLTGGLDHTNHGLSGWIKDFAKYADDDGWLKALLWTVLGGAFFVALILETTCFLLSAKDGVAYAAYVGALGWTLKLKSDAEEKGQ